MKKMRSILAFLLAVSLVAAAGCNTKPAQSEPAPQESAPSSGETPVSQAASAAADDVPQIFKDKQIKCAIIRNLTADDGTKLMMATCTEIGEKWGWQVDTFITNNDDLKFQETVTQAIQKDYDAIYISHGKKEYSYDLLKPAIEKGIKVVTFDTVADGPDGNPIEGVTAIAQDDLKMADLTLNRICELSTNGEPVKVLKLWYGPGGAPALDKRNITYEEYEKAGKIVTVETIGPTNMEDVMGDTANRVSAALALYKKGEIDAMWGSWDELAKGGLKAIQETGRTEIKLVTVDCSDVDLNLMRENPDVFLACVGCYQTVYAQVGMRLLAYKLAELDTPATYEIPVQLVEGALLKPDTNVENLGEVVEGWGENTDYVAPWMEKLGT